MIYKIKYFIYRVKKLFKWIPIVWNLCDWDYDDAIQVFRQQLLDLSDHLCSGKSLAISSESRGNRLKMIIRLMDKVYDEEYALAYFDQLDALYGKAERELEFIELGDDSENKGKKLYRLKHRFEDHPNFKEIKEKEQELFLAAHNKQKRAHKLLWDLIEHNIQSMWD